MGKQQQYSHTVGYAAKKKKKGETIDTYNYMV